MAVAMAQAQSLGSAREGEKVDGAVSHSVYNLIHAFTDGLNVFKRLKERRWKKKSKHKGTGGEAGAERGRSREEKDDAESQLSSSLRRGPMELKETYGRCYEHKGEEFARGDSIAHASLAETLIRLNTGLVGIIATFLNHDSKHSDMKLDYKSLTNLSDVSRREAMESLNQLYYRLSQSQIQLQRMANLSPSHSDKEKRKRSNSRQRVNGVPMVARASIKNSNGQTQLVMVRPKNNARKGSMSGSGTSSSSSSTKSPLSTAVSSPYTSPLCSPLPQYSPKDPFPPQKAPASKAAGRKRADSFTDYRPTTWPHTKIDEVAPLSFPHGPFGPSSGISPSMRKSPPAPVAKPDLSTPSYYPFGPLPPISPTLPSSPRTVHPALRDNKTSSPPSAAATMRRRLDKATPSSYTFASDSTKLGEIPQRNWTTPWDWEEAERLNALAAAQGVQVPVSAVKKGERKRGFFGFMRRGSVH